MHCSDGWDRTAQVVPLAELLLDPYYRTIEVEGKRGNEGGREGGREGGMEGGREGGREGGMKR